MNKILLAIIFLLFVNIYTIQMLVYHHAVALCYISDLNSSQAMIKLNQIKYNRKLDKISYYDEQVVYLAAAALVKTDINSKQIEYLTIGVDGKMDEVTILLDKIKETLIRYKDYK
jgi:hypothetical protein